MYRQEKEWETLGVSLSRAIMSNWIIASYRDWLFSGSPKGVEASAGIYTLIETAKANSLSPIKYIQFILCDIPGTSFLEYPEYLEEYMPWGPLIQKLCQ